MQRLRIIWREFVERLKAVVEIWHVGHAVVYIVVFVGGPAATFLVTSSRTFVEIFVLGAVIGAVWSYGHTPVQYSGAGRERRSRLRSWYVGLGIGVLVLFCLTLLIISPEFVRDQRWVEPFHNFLIYPYVLAPVVLLEAGFLMYFIVAAVVLSGPKQWR